MKKIILILLFFSQCLFAQWKTSSWMSNNRINHLGQYINQMYMVHGQLIYYSNDNGFTWHPGGNLPDSFDIKTTYLAGYLFAGGPGCLLTSTDFGLNWSLRNDSFPSPPSVTAFLDAGSEIYAGTENGVFSSSDGGVSWTGKNYGLDSIKGVKAMLNYKDKIFISTGYNIYLYDMTSEKWSIKKKGIQEFYTFDKMCRIDSNIFIGTHEDTYSGGINKIFLSTDLGETWAEINNVPYYKAYTYYMAASGKRIFISAFDSLYVSEDMGKTWLNETGSLPEKLKLGIHGFYTYLDNLFALSGSDLYRSIDAGKNWTCLYKADNYGAVYTLASDGNQIYAGASPNREMNSSMDGIFISTDMGDSWKPSGLPFLDVLSLKVNKTDIYAITNFGNFRSQDKGKTWNTKNEGFPPDASIWSLDFGENVIAVAAGDKGVILSFDDGKNWESKNSGLPVPHQKVSYIKVFNNMLFAGLDSSFFVSGDMGNSWMQRDFDLPTDFNMFWQIERLDSALYLVGRFGIYYSSDFGISWKNISIGLPSWEEQNYKDYYRCRIILNGKNIFAGINAIDGGIFFSEDNGENWLIKNEGIINRSESISSFAIAGDYIFTATNSGIYGPNGDRIYKAKLSDFLTSVNDIAVTEDGIKIAPNPASDYIEIFQLSESSKLSEGSHIKIYNVFGEEIPPRLTASGTPQEGNLENSSSQYSILNTQYYKLDVSSLPPGIYFVRVGEKTGKFVKY